jgi:hypothetical protein
MLSAGAYCIKTLYDRNKYCSKLVRLSDNIIEQWSLPEKGYERP